MNTIPKKIKRILAELLCYTNSGKPGDIFEIVPNEMGGLSGTNINTEKEWYIFLSTLRNENVFRIIEIV